MIGRDRLPVSSSRQGERRRNWRGVSHVALSDRQSGGPGRGTPAGPPPVPLLSRGRFCLSPDSLGWKIFYVTGCLFVAVQNLEDWEVRPRPPGSLLRQRRGSVPRRGPGACPHCSWATASSGAVFPLEAPRGCS